MRLRQARKIVRHARCGRGSRYTGSQFDAANYHIRRAERVQMRAWLKRIGVGASQTVEVKVSVAPGGLVVCKG